MIARPFLAASATLLVLAACQAPQAPVASPPPASPTSAATAPAATPGPGVTPIPAIATPTSGVASRPPGTPGPGSPALRVVAEGGLCPYGPCHTETILVLDGSYTATRGDGEVRRGQVPRADVDALLAEVEKADFAAIRSKPFTGTCPTAYDGSELEYTFPTAPGAPEIASCTVAIDEADPLFVAVLRVVEAMQAP
jgi:hypothetical protein